MNIETLAHTIHNPIGDKNFTRVLLELLDEVTIYSTNIMKTEITTRTVIMLISYHRQICKRVSTQKQDTN